MQSDVLELRDFYHSPVGKTASRLLSRGVRSLWPDVRGCRVLGLGYALPILRPLLGEAERVIAAMPAPQGVIPWPAEANRLSLLYEESALPFPDRFFDRVVLLHSLEHAERIRPALREVWRVLADGGRVVVVVPNRRGLWARLETTPFASGRPYSATQLSLTLEDSLFTPQKTESALFFPPLGLKTARLWATSLENLGRRWFTGLSGVILAEAVKQTWAVPASPQRASSRLKDSLRGAVKLPGGFRNGSEETPHQSQADWPANCESAPAEPSRDHPG